MTTKLVSQTGL